MFKNLLIYLLKSFLKLFARYITGFIVGIAVLVVCKTALNLAGDGNFTANLIPLNLFVTAVPSIFIWHFSNELLAFTKYRSIHKEYISVVVISSGGAVWLGSITSWVGQWAYFENSLSITLFILAAVANCFLYLQVVSRFPRLFPAGR